MMKQTLSLFLWTVLAVYCFTAATASNVPKECAVGTPEYNEADCTETCEQDVHKNEPYCDTVDTPQVETHVPVVPVTTTQVNLPQAVTRHDGYYDGRGACSFGVSLQSSIVFSAAGILIGFLLH